MQNFFDFDHFSLLGFQLQFDHVHLLYPFADKSTLLDDIVNLVTHGIFNMIL